jgi:hypothetical protein
MEDSWEYGPEENLQFAYKIGINSHKVDVTPWRPLSTPGYSATYILTLYGSRPDIVKQSLWPLLIQSPWVFPSDKKK